MFTNREDAGRQLARKLEHYRETDAVVLALPRGGVVVGYEIAKAFHFPLDIVAVRKIGHPSNPEYAICATDEKGMLLCNEEERGHIDAEWLKEEVERQRQEAARRLKVYRGNKEPVEIKGKTVIITDDGIATGLTMRLAIAAVKAQEPKRVVVAVPVASPEVARGIKSEVDEFIVLLPPEEFLGAVGAHYAEFDQTADEEVIRLLKGSP